MLMIDATCENLISLSKAKLPGNPHIATRWRWAGKGVRGVRLETIVVGGQRFTSVEAVSRFIAALNEPGSVPSPRIPAAEVAVKKLIEMGA